VLLIPIRNPVLFWPRDPDSGWEKIQRQDPGSGMNIPDLIFENFVSVFWVKILKFLFADLDPGLVNPGSTSQIRNTVCKKLRSGGSGINIPDHISEKQFFGFKILKFFDADPNPGSGIFFTLDPGRIGYPG
jgi:hypothetical protein